MAQQLTRPSTFLLPTASAHAPSSLGTQPILVVQGLYYVFTGLWAVFDMTTFQAVTGPKTDVWLVRTFGLVIAVVGLAFLVAARHRTAAAETVVAAVGVAAVLAAADVAYVVGGRISAIYLLDAAAEAALVAWWILGRPRDESVGPTGPEPPTP